LEQLQHPPAGLLLPPCEGGGGQEERVARPGKGNDKGKMGGLAGYTRAFDFRIAVLAANTYFSIATTS
jgi:hypothetical protein